MDDICIKLLKLFGLFEKETDFFSLHLFPQVCSTRMFFRYVLFLCLLDLEVVVLMYENY